MDIRNDLGELCEIVSEKISDKIRKIRSNGMSDGDLETLDKLTHTLKSTKGTLKLMDEEDGEYSGRYPMSRGGSYYSGRKNARRDSMGRYSGEYGYSRNDLADKMRDLMHDAPDERTRQEIQRMVEKLEA